MPNPKHTPSPQTFHMVPARLQEPSFRVGLAYTTGNAIEAFRPCAGVARGRVRFKGTGAGQLEVRMAQPDGQTAYDLPAVITAAVAANTETLIDFEPHGEAYYHLKFVPAGNGVVTFVDECGL